MQPQIVGGKLNLLFKPLVGKVRNTELQHLCWHDEFHKYSCCLSTWCVVI